MRAGGRFVVTMRSPEGVDMVNPGVYLEVVPDKRIVTTDAYTEACVPSAKPFMTLVLTFDDEAGGARYTARARHWNAEDKKAHKDMGFHMGWGQCTGQLEKLVARI